MASLGDTVPLKGAPTTKRKTASELFMIAYSWIEPILANVLFWIVHIVCLAGLVLAMVAAPFKSTSILYGYSEALIALTTLVIMITLIVKFIASKVKGDIVKLTSLIYMALWILLTIAYFAGCAIATAVITNCATYPECYAATAGDIVTSGVPPSTASARFIAIFVFYGLELVCTLMTSFLVVVSFFLEIRNSSVKKSEEQ